MKLTNFEAVTKKKGQEEKTNYNKGKESKDVTEEKKGAGGLYSQRAGV